MENMAGEGKGDDQSQGSNERGQMSTVHMSPKANVCRHDPMKPPRRMRRCLVEVFSVKFLEFEKHNMQEQMYGCIFIYSQVSYVVLDRIKKRAPLNIDDEGFVRLRGPNRVIIAADWVRFSPHLLRFRARAGPLICEEDEELALWDIHTRREYNMFLTESSETQFGPIVVNYAVYNDGIEAWVDVRVETLQFPAPAVYGTVTARNSNLPQKEAESVLFNKKREERIYLDVDKGKFSHLPLSRSKTAHPNGSDAIISLNIMQRGITEAEDQPIASNVDLRFTTGLSCQEEQTTGNDVFRIVVNVAWHTKEEPFNRGPRVI